MRPDVCCIEWDGCQYLGVTVDIYCYVFIVECFEPFDLALQSAYQRCPSGWCRPDSMEFEPRPDLVRLAIRRVREHWDLYAIANGHTPEHRPSFRMYYDPRYEVEDRRADIAKLLKSIADGLDMNKRLGHQSE